MTTTEREPQPIAAALNSALGIVLAEWQAECTRDPENTFKPGICRHCGQSLGETDDDKVIPMGVLGFLPNICCEPCAIKGKAKIADDYRKAEDMRLQGVIPSEYLHWDASKGNRDALAMALGKLSMTERRCMVLHGRTGSGKTRIAWELVKRIAGQPEHFSWHWLDAFEVADKGFPKEARTADYLIIDDLGNEPKKGWETKWETELLYVIRRRCDWRKPLIITTQLTPEEFKKRFFNTVAAEAIMRRFRERTDSVAT